MTPHPKMCSGYTQKEARALFAQPRTVPDTEQTGAETWEPTP